MLAIEITRHGGPGALRPEPVPSADELLVRNRWIGVNYVDLQHREGRPYPVELPLVPGIEAAGEVVATGPDADAALLGRPVVHFGHLSGVYAELTAVGPKHVVALAPDVPLDVAAAVAMCGTTAHVLTREAARPGAGDAVVVQAAAGATGGAVVARRRRGCDGDRLGLDAGQGRRGARARGRARVRALRDAGSGGSGARRDRRRRRGARL